MTADRTVGSQRTRCPLSSNPWRMAKRAPRNMATRELSWGGEKVTNEVKGGVGEITDIRPLEPNTLEQLRMGGAMSRSLFGNLNGMYTLECEQVPSEEEICQALRLRIDHDYGQFREREDKTELAAWHGGWTCEGIGIFSADIWCQRSGQRARHLGRACVKVETHKHSGSRGWSGIAC